MSIATKSINVLTESTKSLRELVNSINEELYIRGRDDDMVARFEDEQFGIVSMESDKFDREVAFLSYKK